MARTKERAQRMKFRNVDDFCDECGLYFEGLQTHEDMDGDGYHSWVLCNDCHPNPKRKADSSLRNYFTDWDDAA